MDWAYLMNRLCRVLSLVALVWAWRHAAGHERERIAWVTLPMGASWVVFLLLDIAFTFDLRLPHAYLFWDVTTFLSYRGLVCAAVRYRVLDIGFAVNRAPLFTVGA
jgi:hypothetical protein